MITIIVVYAVIGAFCAGIELVVVFLDGFSPIGRSNINLGKVVAMFFAWPYFLYNFLQSK